MPFERDIRVSLKRFYDRLSEKRRFALIRAGERLFPIVQERIHKRGEKADGTKIGKYKEGSHKRERIKRGLPVDTINLVFDQILLQSEAFEVTPSPAVKMVVTNPDRAKILGYLEDRYGNIAGLQKLEIALFRKFYVEEYNKLR